MTYLTFTIATALAPSDSDDVLVGGALGDIMDGLGGKDDIRGLGGNDTLFGGTGNDTLRGGGGDDQLRGDHGNDILFGGPGQDFLSGGRDNDNLRGNADSDVLVGGPGDDTLIGGGGDDKLRGGTGDDRLIGGPGRDALGGGAGEDSFIFSNLAHSPAGNGDRIIDFEVGLDKIQLSGIDADSERAGNQEFIFIGANSFSGAAGELGYVRVGSNAVLRGDTDGDGITDLEITLLGVSTITAADIVGATQANTAPVATDDLIDVLSGQGVSFDALANDFDPDGDAIRFLGLVSAPTLGGVEVAADGTMQYFAPLTDVGLTDSLIYRIEDAFGVTDTATVIFNIEASEVL